MRFRLLGPEGAALTGICILGFRACRARPGYSADISAQDSDDARLSVRNAPGFRRAALTGISILGTGEVSKLGRQISSGTLCSLALEVLPSQNY
jgi:hypothetical protein